MKLQMHSIRFDADQKLIQFIQKKADKLDTFFDRIIDGEVFMRLDKDDNMENKIIEIKLNIPKNQLFVKERAKSFEAASDQAVEALRRQIIKHKDKTVSY
ncbi:MAG: HPF/RaiA family ribosome-associated protein [Cyclobacteriaceae bacterium]|nr:HPF/RaiA family ribosome-associated protein [Cyclobacteriaceae bacterium]